MTRKIALSPAGGLVAEAVLEKFSESGFSPDSLVLLDQPSNAGKRVAYGGSYLGLADQQGYDFSECSLLLLLAEDAELEAAALQQGCPLVGHALDEADVSLFGDLGGDEPEIAYSASRIRVAGAEASCLLPSLLELERLAPIATLNLVLLRSAEFHGKAGVDELASQTVNLLNARPVEPRIFAEQMAFNLIPEPTDPSIGADLLLNLGNSSCSPVVQSVNVPLFHGFAAAVQVELDGEVPLEQYQQRLSSLENLNLKSTGGTPISDCNQSFTGVVCHMQQAPERPAGLQFWMIADPMRYGLANNYVNVVDFLLKSFL